MGNVLIMGVRIMSGTVLFFHRNSMLEFFIEFLFFMKSRELLSEEALKVFSRLPRWQNFIFSASERRFGLHYGFSILSI